MTTFQLPFDIPEIESIFKKPKTNPFRPRSRSVAENLLNVEPQEQSIKQQQTMAQSSNDGNDFVMVEGKDKNEIDLAEDCHVTSIAFGQMNDLIELGSPNEIGDGSIDSNLPFDVNDLIEYVPIDEEELIDFSVDDLPSENDFMLPKNQVDNQNIASIVNEFDPIQSTIRNENENISNSAHLSFLSGLVEKKTRK